MKKISIIIPAVFAILLFCMSCEKKLERTAEYTSPQSNEALLKINYNSAYALNPGIQLSLNKTRVSNVITTRTPFPGGGYNTSGGNFPDYLTVTPGSVELSVAIPKKNTNIDSVVLFTKSITLDAAKNYTAHITDTGANTKIVVLTDDISKPDTGTSKYRFVNLMPNVPAIDLYYGTTVVAANIAYLASSNYFTLPTTNQTAQAWTIRPAGSAPTSTALATYTSSNTILAQRVYTAFAVGYSGSTDAVRKPYISFLLNR